MEAHPKNFEGFVDTERPFDHYLSVMRQRGQSFCWRNYLSAISRGDLTLFVALGAGTYGGHMELTAFARCKGRAVKVIMPEVSRSSTSTSDLSRQV